MGGRPCHSRVVGGWVVVVGVRLPAVGGLCHLVGEGKFFVEVGIQEGTAFLVTLVIIPGVDAATANFQAAGGIRRDVEGAEPEGAGHLPVAICVEDPRSVASTPSGLGSSPQRTRPRAACIDDGSPARDVTGVQGLKSVGGIDELQQS